MFLAVLLIRIMTSQIIIVEQNFKILNNRDFGEGVAICHENV